MTIITINGTPITDFIVRFLEALGTEGAFAILLCIVCLFAIKCIKWNLKNKRDTEERKKLERQEVFYEKELERLKKWVGEDYENRKDEFGIRLNKLTKWASKNNVTYY